jgi:creatinine amidohydrolase
MRLADLTWPQVQSLDRNCPVIVPLAAMEQHGDHLPLYTDSYLLEEIVRRVERAAGHDVLIAPLQWLGNSHHHRDFPGTLSAEPRLYLDLVRGLLSNLIADGFRRILVLNGHGGNEVPAQQSLFEIRQAHRARTDLLLLFSSYWRLASVATAPELDWQQSEMGHACEWETSMMLCLAPHLVGDYGRVLPVDPRGSFLPAYRPWVTQDRSPSGHIGYPHRASREKGERLLADFSGGVLQLLERMQQWNGEPWRE